MAAGCTILVLDQGTTSSRALLLDREGRVTGLAQEEFRQLFPRPGWVEHDPLDIWNSQLNCIRQVLREQALEAGDLEAIGITNQRETTLVWNRRTGDPLGNAIVWQDRRTAPRCDELKAAGHEALIRERTGLLPDAYFSATKLEWLLDQDADLRKQAADGEWLFGTVDSWLIWKLTGGRAHVTDATNAGRTMLFDIHRQAWDTDLLDLFRVPAAMLPEVLDSSARFGETDSHILGAAVPITGVAGDQQAAMFGQQCVDPGMVKNTYGTGCFIMLNTGAEPIASAHRLVTTPAWRLNGQVTYALEGSIFTGGAVVQWLRDGLGFIRESAEVEALAAGVEDHGGVYCVPAFTGLGAPYWDSYATGILIGLSRGTTAGHIARAALEAIAFQSYDVVSAMAADAALPIRELRVDGGAARNDLLMQFQADLLQQTVVRPQVIESTALGAGFLAGLQTGFWPDREMLRDIWRPETIFRPRSRSNVMEDHIKGWQAAVERAQHWRR